MKIHCLALACALVLGGCAGAPREIFSAPLADPHEKSNRAVAEGTLAFNRAAIRPLTEAYEALVPAPVRNSVLSAQRNLDEPRIFANTILQGRFEAGNATLGRFIVNTTLGIGGLFDIAAIAGVPRQTGDFGQTLYVWGAPTGDFLFLPVIGPTTGRDAVGRIVDITLDPVSWAIVAAIAAPRSDYINGALSVLEFGEGARLLNEVERDSVDPYGRLKNLWEQRRAAELAAALRESAAQRPR